MADLGPARGPERPHTGMTAPAVIVAIIALVAALGGTAMALPGKNTVDSNDIKKNAVKSKHVKKDALKGADIDEASLAQVPSAAKADSAASADDLIILPLKTLEGGDREVLATVGPFSVELECRDTLVGTEAWAFARTTEKNGVLSSLFAVNNADFDPSDTEMERLLLVQADGPGPPAAMFTSYTETFALSAPSGASLTGSLHVLADDDGSPTGTCKVWGDIVRNG